MQLSGLLLILDAFAAVGFALGLAFGVTGISSGLLRAAPWLALLAASAALRGLLAKAAAEAGAGAALTVKAFARRHAFAAVLAQPPGGARTAGESMAAVVEGVEALDGYFSRFIPARLASAAAPLVVIAAAAFASPISAAIMTATLIPFIVGMVLAGLSAAEESRRQFQALERLSGLFLDRVRALPLILAFQGEAVQVRALTLRADELQRRTASVLRIAFISSGVLEFFAAISVAVVAVYCGFNLLRLLPFPVPETLDLTRALFVLALAPEVYAPMRRLAAAYHDRQAAEAAVASLAPLSQATQPLTVAPPPSLDRAPAIRFVGATVLYPGTDRPVFDRFDLDVPPDSITVVLGPSGAGKSTLLHLLLGLAPLSAGEVWIDGLQLSAVGSFAPLIAWAGQAPLIVPGTLADNIALARRGATHEEIAEAAERVGLGGALGARTMGLDARLDERGGGLSGGERRRLAFARALLKPAPILLLDEPTANLDVESERRMLSVITEAAKGRTTLIATHSDRVAALADQVIRL